MLAPPKAPAEIDDRECAGKEDRRLAALRSYRMIGAGSDPGLDRIVGLTATSFGMPMAWISLVDDEFSWLVARIGVVPHRLPRLGLPCEGVIATSEVVVANDDDSSLRDRRLLPHLPDVRFYAGAPLLTGEGHAIGTLCVLDTVPHADFCEARSHQLAAFADLVMDRLQTRHSASVDAAAIGFAKAAEYAFLAVDGAGAISFCNPSAEILFGYSAGEMLGQRIEIIIPEPLRAAHRAGLARIVAGGVSHLAGRTIELTALHRDGRTFPIEFSMSLWQEADGIGTGGIGMGAIIRDISEWRARDAKLVQLAHHDKLTGLTNRAHFDERLDASLETDRRATVMLLDLDGFKEVNDSLGHATGDSLLQAVAVRLSSCVTPDATVARFGGDEFAILLQGEADPRKAAACAATILTAFQTPFPVAGHIFHVGLSIGAAIGGPGTAGDELIADADLALYQAKRDGRRCLRLFEQPMRSAVVARRALHDELTRAVQNAELVLHYQPQVELASGRIIGAEALLRWQHPARGLLMPVAFIDALEAHPLATSVGQWIVEDVCRQSALWQAAGLPPLRLAVNLFGSHLRNGTLAAEVLASLARHAVPPHLLEIEVTERIALQADDTLLDPLRELHRHGVSIAFDDFGTGYASLSSLKRFPLSRLKIDRSFVRDILTDRHDAEIVRAVLGMAQSFGLDVIAEGIETAEQDTMLRMMGCREGQGYRYGRAMPADALAALISSVPDMGRRSEKAA
ncbi:putative bifunctional diguanylate cyclase/phosphodiesterase [Methylobacterium marchantiae]|uniref:Bifunctional diguanylate cyclase/phosphodiesterase n=2 Tax=Methylobacterium marchantiae TaxID=600331 RepID=A0ABW3WTZ1_9HYPH